jgi:surface antigen
LKNRNKAILSLALSATCVAANPSWAMAAANFESCTAVAGKSYQCVSSSGYRGTDPYNVNRFSTQAADGSLHSCTSYVAYRLFYSNPYMPQITNFDSAQFWATQAVAKVGAILAVTPKVGDVAWWSASTVPDKGHVAVVDAVTLNASGAVVSIQVSDDNARRLITTTRVLYPGVSYGSISYPEKFIRFPSLMFGGGGGKPPVATATPLSSNDQMNSNDQLNSNDQTAP